MQENQDQRWLLYYPSNKRGILDDHPLRVVKAHVRQNLKINFLASPIPHSQKRPPSNLAESLPKPDYLSAISLIRPDRFGLGCMTICFLVPQMIVLL